jgi:hypothetical protein
MHVARSLLLLSLAIMAGAFVSLTALEAQTSGAQIKQYDVSIEIEPDGDVLVVEDIVYDFGPYERHGTYRALQYRSAYDDQYEQWLLDSIFRDGDQVLFSDLKTEFVGRLKKSPGRSLQRNGRMQVVPRETGQRAGILDRERRREGHCWWPAHRGTGVLHHLCVGRLANRPGGSAGDHQSWSNAPRDSKGHRHDAPRDRIPVRPRHHRG